MLTREQQVNLPAVARRIAFKYAPGTRSATRGSTLSAIPGQLITEDALAAINAGSIPDLRYLCTALYEAFRNADWQNIMVAAPILRALELPDAAAMARFEADPVTRHVLVQNTRMKVVLIHWPPGAVSSIHGHPKGGCLFRVLKGTVEELRCASEDQQQLYARSHYYPGSIAYIDDHIGHHVVGNPSNTSAFSIHVYLS